MDGVQFYGSESEYRSLHHSSSTQSIPVYIYFPHEKHAKSLAFGLCLAPIS